MSAQPRNGFVDTQIEPIRLSPSDRPILFVVVDTEEEFDWNAPFTRNQTSVGHLQHIKRVQRLFDRYDIRPTYVIDYPVATQAQGYEPIKEIVESRRGTVGAHLHPWVTPPYTEKLSPRNSFACNLSPAEERAKLETLTAAITENLGVTPRIYKAGRYGIGRATVPLLETLGFDVDQSVMPHADFSGEGGPSFRAFDSEPFLFGEHRRLLELPCTSGYIGLSGPAAPLIHDLVSSPALGWAHMVGVAARLRIVDRLVLSPEGFSGSEMRRLTSALLSRGGRTFTLSFHSPSIDPGHTPYVRTSGDLERFLVRIESYLEYFLGSLAGTTATPQEFRTSALARGGHAVASSQAHGMAT